VAGGTWTSAVGETLTAYGGGTSSPVEQPLGNTTATARGTWMAASA